jgi:uroporphyrinogen-III synthase
MPVLGALTLLLTAFAPQSRHVSVPAIDHQRAGRSYLVSTAPVAILTREDGKNGKLRTLLEASGVATQELPCIAFERLDGFGELCDTLRSTDAHVKPLKQRYPWIVITSPEAATVFAEAWAASSVSASDRPRIASVGAGTAQVLEKAGFSADFVPSKATGKALAAELPAEGDAVLYPASALAASTIADGLAARGVSTRRIDTYTTVPAPWTSDDLARAQAAAVVTFASPSAVRVWAERVGTTAAAVCIGETSAAQARECGFERVFAPDKPGVESWATCCVGVINEA